MDTPSDEIKDQPTDGDISEGHQGGDSQEPSSDQPVDVPDDKAEEQPADSQDQQTGEKQESSDKVRPSTPSDDQEAQQKPSTLPDHQEEISSLPADQPSSPLTPSHPNPGHVDDKPVIPSDKVDHQEPVTDNAADKTMDDQAPRKEKTNQDNQATTIKMTGNNIDEEQEKLNELYRQAPPQSADDQLPQTGDNEHGRLIAAFGGLLTGLAGLCGALYARKKG